MGRIWAWWEQTCWHCFGASTRFAAELLFDLPQLLLPCCFLEEEKEKEKEAMPLCAGCETFQAPAYAFSLMCISYSCLKKRKRESVSVTTP